MEKMQINNFLNLKKINKAFTLAEVLITLGIIGVVAALTIPTLMNNTNNAENIAAWKKAYSTINQAIMLSNNDYGGSFAGVITTTHDSIVPILTRYLKVTKVCAEGSTFGNCFHTNANWKHADGSAIDSSGEYHENDDSGGIILSNGNLIKWCTETCNASTIDCGTLKIDVNGWKGPNIVGKDIFGFYISATGMKPYGYQGDVHAGTCATTGYGCSADYLFK